MVVVGLDCLFVGAGFLVFWGFIVVGLLGVWCCCCVGVVRVSVYYFLFCVFVLFWGFWLLGAVLFWHSNV